MRVRCSPRGREAAFSGWTWAMVWILAGAAWSPALAGQVVYPVKDGTLADGVSGPFDGTADFADWYFNSSNFDGAITLSTAGPTGSYEYRLVWEYNLSGVTLAPPVEAILYVTIRGAPIWPFPPMSVNVYAYPADLVESMADFAAGPAVYQGCAVVQPFQPGTLYAIDLSTEVNNALSSGGDKVGVRFQIDPATPYPQNQAFIDAVDSDSTTKPFLSIQAPPSPGDLDANGSVDTLDLQAFVSVLMDGAPPTNPEYALRADLNGDLTVDGLDVQLFVDAFLSQ
ncbi:MAG: dockerin type I domain-containing protein [Phycisphaerae bacterium]